MRENEIPIGNAKNLTNQKFGKLTALYRVRNDKVKDSNRKAYWKCQCDCGKETVVESYSLTHGITKSCGCLLRFKTESLVNKTFGEFIVLEENIYLNQREYLKCKCSCGNIVTKEKHNITSGNTKSCGCLRTRLPHPRKDLTGNKYGRLTVLGFPERSDRGITWLCKCECGKEVRKVGSDLKAENCNSCGCLKAELIRKRFPLVGQRFGKLIAIEDIGTAKDGQIIYRCQCDCGNEVQVLAGNLKKGNSQSCGCINSRGNLQISIWLKEHNIPFKREVFEEECKTEKGNGMRFDFQLFPENSQKIFLEYQGDIHFPESIHKSGWNTKESYLERKLRDDIKFNYCKNNNIQLFYITYKENIEERLEEICQQIMMQIQ